MQETYGGLAILSLIEQSETSHEAKVVALSVSAYACTHAHSSRICNIRVRTHALAESILLKTCEI